MDDPGERTITVIGPRLGPHGADALAWDGLDDTDAVYLTAGDVERRAPRPPRRACSWPRRAASTRSSEAHVELDALVSSGRDPGELLPPGRARSRAEGWWCAPLGAPGRRVGDAPRASAASGSPLRCPGPVGDAYGAGDSFAAGLTYGLGAGWDIDRAVELAARCGAACMTGRGPYEGQLTL